RTLLAELAGHTAQPVGSALRGDLRGEGDAGVSIATPVVATRAGAGFGRTAGAAVASSFSWVVAVAVAGWVVGGVGVVATPERRHGNDEPREDPGTLA